MSTLNPQALELNKIIQETSPNVLKMLSERGKAIYFPKKGILSQSAEAKGKNINATIGIALEEDGRPMVLPCIRNMINFPNCEESFTYAPSFGNPDIRRAWNERLKRQNPSLVNKTFSQPVVTSALTHGLNMAAYLFLDESDTVISPDLYWENYELIFCNAFGAKIKTFPMFDSGSFNLKGLKSATGRMKSKKAVIVLNFPNNPSGYTVTRTEAQAIKEILSEAASEKPVVCLIDDAYFGLAYEEDIIKESLFSLLSDAHENLLAVKLDGPTKEEYVWGFRTGFITYGIKAGSPQLYQALENKTGGAVRGSISNAANLSQTLLVKSYSHENYPAERKEKFEILKKRYLKVREILEKHPEYREYFEALPFNSGYFMCVKVKNGEAEKIRQLLLEKYSTGVIVFENLLRLAFSATPASKLETLFDNIFRACRDLDG